MTRNGLGLSELRTVSPEFPRKTPDPFVLPLSDIGSLHDLLNGAPPANDPWQEYRMGMTTKIPYLQPGAEAPTAVSVLSDRGNIQDILSLPAGIAWAAAAIAGNPGYNPEMWDGNHYLSWAFPESSTSMAARDELQDNLQRTKQ